jgi:hypothetical protein
MPLLLVERVRNIFKTLESGRGAEFVIRVRENTFPKQTAHQVNH